MYINVYMLTLVPYAAFIPSLTVLFTYSHIYIYHIYIYILCNILAHSITP